MAKRITRTMKVTSIECIVANNETLTMERRRVLCEGEFKDKFSEGEFKAFADISEDESITRVFWETKQVDSYKTEMSISEWLKYSHKVEDKKEDKSKG